MQKRADERSMAQDAMAGNGFFSQTGESKKSRRAARGGNERF